MDDPLRRLVAYVAGAATTGQEAGGVFDFEVGSRFPVTGSVADARVDVTDATDGARLTGTLPDLRRGDGEALELRLDGDDFEGVDRTSGHAFHGRVSGRNIDLTDAADGVERYYCL